MHWPPKLLPRLFGWHRDPVPPAPEGHPKDDLPPVPADHWDGTGETYIVLHEADLREWTVPEHRYTRRSDRSYATERAGAVAKARGTEYWVARLEVVSRVRPGEPQVEEVV